MSSRFALATQVLTVIASAPQRPHRSEDLASWAKTNAAVVRKLLQMLNRAGITSSQLGKGGGAMLARPASEISLADIYRAVEETPLLAMPRSEPDATCTIGANIGALVIDAVHDAERAFEEALAKRTIGHLVADLSFPFAVDGMN